MRHLAILILALTPVACRAQAAPFPAALTFHMRQGQPYPWNSTVYPASKFITVTAAGAWTATRGGTLSAGCSGPCFTLSPSSGNGNATITVSFLGSGSELLGPGTHSGTVTIGGSVVALTVEVQKRLSYDAFVYPPGYPMGCVNTSSSFPHADTCTISGERPSSTALPIPSAGGSYTDPNFGNTVIRLTNSGNNIQYGALSAFSATSKYVLTSDPEGFLNIYRLADRSVAYGPISSGINISLAAWDPVDNEKLWYLEGSTIRNRALNSGVVTVAADYTNAFGARPALPAITMGGTVDITDDGWWAFRSGNTLCAVNLNGLTAATQESRIYCADMGPLGLYDIDFTQITQVDSESRKRYVVVLSAPLGHVFSVGASGLQYEYPLPSNVVEPHSDVGQDSHGRQIFFWNYGDPYGSRSYLATMQLNKGADMIRPVEEGGGLRFLYPSEPHDSQTDGHFGCTWKGVCVFAPYGNSAGIAARSISAVTPATPCIITTAIAHGYSNGASVLIGGATGIIGINGVFTVTVTGPNNYTLNGRTCTGTYTANSANSVLNAATASQGPNRQEIVMVRPGHEIRRIAIHRTKIYDNGSTLLGYYATPRASISRDGRYVAFVSNMGIPESSSVYVADAGAPTATVRLAAGTVDEAGTKAILNYTAPAGESGATITVSVNPDLSSPVLSANDGLSSVSRQYVVTGLTANTDYWYRIATGRYAMQGQFRTAAVLLGTSLLRLERGGGGTIRHGPTTELGSSGASPLEITAARGVYYYNMGGATQAVVIH
jgi:hypothetical protein